MRLSWLVISCLDCLDSDTAVVLFLGWRQLWVILGVIAGYDDTLLCCNVLQRGSNRRQEETTERLGHILNPLTERHPVEVESVNTAQVPYLKTLVLQLSPCHVDDKIIDDSVLLSPAALSGKAPLRTIDSACQSYFGSTVCTVSMTFCGLL